MGRTPRPVYQDGIILNFFIKDEVIHYKTLAYGSNQKPFDVLTGIYENNADELIEKTKDTVLIDHNSLGFRHTYWCANPVKAVQLVHSELDNALQSFSTVSNN